MPLRIFTHSVLSFNFLKEGYSDIWVARIIDYKGLTDQPGKEFMQSLLEYHDKGIKAIALKIKYLFRIYRFNKDKLNTSELIKTLHPATYSYQENRIATISLLFSCISIALSSFIVLKTYAILDVTSSLFISLALLCFLLILVLFISIKPITTYNYDLSKFDIDIAIKNYVKRFLSKYNYNNPITVVFIFRIKDDISSDYLNKFLKEIKKLYRNFDDALGSKFIMAIEIKENMLPMIKEDIIENIQITR